jgi:hypothetical protein
VGVSARQCANGFFAEAAPHPTRCSLRSQRATLPTRGRDFATVGAINNSAPVHLPARKIRSHHSPSTKREMFMERRHFLKIAFGFAAGAAALAASAQAAPLAPHPLLEDGSLPETHPDAHPAVTSAEEVDHLKPEEVRWGRHWHHRWHRRHWGWHRRHWGWRRRHWGWRRRHWGWRRHHWGWHRRRWHRRYWRRRYW